MNKNIYNTDKVHIFMKNFLKCECNLNINTVKIYSLYLYTLLSIKIYGYKRESILLSSSQLNNTTSFEKY